MSEQFITDRMYCTADTHVLASYPSQNFHAADYTNIGVAGGQQAVGLFAFGNSHGIPANARILWARMYFLIDYASDSNVYTFTARPCSGSWSETGVTYNSLPVTTDTADTVSIGNSTRYIDITNTFNAWRGGSYSMANGLYITCPTANSRKRLKSRTASSADDRPYLQICYAFPTGTPSTDKSEYTLGDTVNVTVTPVESGDTHTLRYKIGNTILANHANISTSDSYATAINLANYITDSASGILTVECETFRNGVSQGTETITAGLNIPASVVPTISSVAVAEGADSFPSELSGIFVQNKSKFFVTISAAGAYGSMISSYSTVTPVGTYSGSSFTTDFVTQSGSNSIAVTVTDSRGRTATYTASVSVVAYSPPAIGKFSIARCLQNGTLDRSGTYASAAITASASAISDENDFSVCVQYRAVGASAWTSSDNIPPTNYSVDTNGTVLTDSGVETDDFDDLTGYEFRLVVSDSFTAIYASDTMPTKKIVLDIHPSGEGIGFGVEAEQGKFKTAWAIDGLEGAWITAAPASADITAPSGITAYDGALRYRKCGNAVHLGGGVTVSNKVLWTNKLITTLPVGYRPKNGNISWVAVAGNNNDWYYARMYINASGELYLMHLYTQEGNNRSGTAWVSLEKSWFID